MQSRLVTVGISMVSHFMIPKKPRVGTESPNLWLKQGRFSLVENFPKKPVFDLDKKNKINFVWKMDIFNKYMHLYHIDNCNYGHFGVQSLVFEGISYLLTTGGWVKIT